MSQSRAKERERVFRLLFSAEFHKELSPSEILEARIEAEEGEDFTVSDYVRDTFFGACAFSEEAIRLACENARGWSQKRMSPAMRALLILSVYEILKTDIPVRIAANEAVNLCKQYEDERGAKFLNGILGTISRTYAKEKCEEA